MLLSHLNKQVLMQEIGVDTVVQESIEPVDRLSASVESSNLDIAERLEAAKFKLIDALAVFPVCALWILSKYTQTTCCDEQDKQLSPIEKLNDALIASQSIGFDDDKERRQLVIDTFRVFPFTFEDLLELTDLVIYMFQTIVPCYQSVNDARKKTTELINKRLKNLKRLNHLTLRNVLETLQVGNELFWFVSNEVMYQRIIDVVFAEYGWLRERDQLVERNTKLVSFIANQYKGSFLDFDDLVQEGQTGLLVAVDRFDYHLGCQFSTYAAYWIRQRIMRALSRSERVVRVPCEQIASINRLFRAKDELLVKMGKEPSVEALAAHLSLTVEEVNTMLSISQATVQLEKFDSDDEALSPIDFIEQQVFKTPFKQLVQSELENWLELAIETLNSREAKVVCHHFGLNTDNEMTLQEIGVELNISRERVRQIQVMAFNKIKLNYGEQLVSFL